MKKIFLDTSIISAFFDFNKPLRQNITQKWFEFESKKYILYISTLVLLELENTKNDILRNKFIDFVLNRNISILELNEEIEKISAEYRKKILPNEKNDTIHLATASFYNIDAIASWNFKDIVNIETMSNIHEINSINGYKIIEIVSLENLGGDKYGSL